MERARFQDLIIGILTLLVSAIAYISAREMPEDTQVYTVTVISLFALFGALLVVFSIINRKKPGGRALSILTVKNPVLSTFFVAAYLVLIPLLGFYVASAVFMVAFMLFLGARTPKSIAVAIIAMLLFIYILFTVQLRVPLPRGILF